MAGHVFIAVSVDGYIATVDGGVEWLDEPDVAVLDDGTPDDMGWTEFIDGIDALVMGRASFEKVLSFGEWPYEVPVVVLSSTMTEVPAHLTDQAEVSALEPLVLVESLAARGWNELYVDGGRVVTSFLAAGLVSDLTITTVPVVLGGGIPLFGALPAPITLEHVMTRAFSNGMVQTRHRVAAVG
ncbi:MAG: dihydrofolate reductase family protein [Actinomycetota bacterium]